MWFKQIQVFKLEPTTYLLEDLTSKLEPLTFQPCARSMASTIGWIPILDEEDSPLAEMANHHIMLCLQVEEKILPASVITQELNEKIKLIETENQRKVGQKEKFDLKDEIVLTLLPRAFSKLTQVYGYIDTKNHWLVLGTTNPKKTEQFLSLFKKCITEKVYPLDLKKLSPIMTSWLNDQNYSSSFSIEKACVLQDPRQQNRIIRCQQQDLFAHPIQTLVKEDCEVKQLALTWQDRVNFTLSNDFLLQSIKFQDDVLDESKEMGAETKQQKFQVDFLIMSETFTNLLKDLLKHFEEKTA